MFKTFNDGELFLNHDLVSSVEASPGHNPKMPTVQIFMANGCAHHIRVPEDTNPKDYALKLVTEMNQMKARLRLGMVVADEDPVIQKVGVV